MYEPLSVKDDAQNDVSSFRLSRGAFVVIDRQDVHRELEVRSRNANKVGYSV
jgi:hypothetical protein